MIGAERFEYTVNSLMHELITVIQQTHNGTGHSLNRKFWNNLRWANVTVSGELFVPGVPGFGIHDGQNVCQCHDTFPVI